MNVFCISHVGWFDDDDDDDDPGGDNDDEEEQDDNNDDDDSDHDMILFSTYVLGQEWVQKTGAVS